MKKSLIRIASAAFSAAVMWVSAAVPSISGAADWKIIGYMGDLNGDNEVNIADLVIMSRHITNKAPLSAENGINVDGKFIGIGGNDGYEANATLHTADMDQDGVIDSIDLALMRQNIINKSILPVWEWVEPQKQKFIDPPIKDVEAYLPSQGDANLVIFYVDFPDCKYSYAPDEQKIQEIAFGSENTADNNYPFESMTAFYDRSSKGAMQLKGKVFRYTAKGSVNEYGEDRVKLAFECYNAFNDAVDFSQFDGDGDSYIDATLLSVPTAAGDDNWWPCAGPTGTDYFSVDGKKIGHLITGNAQIEADDDYYNFNSSYLHEMGHCMGLPDYYLYSGDDLEGLHGVAGNELMDVDATTDFCALSKLQLGWYREDQIQVYDYSMGVQTFKLSSAQSENGNCVIIPYKSINDRYQSEYFIIEYNTKDANNSKPQWWQKTDDGIRVYHAEATLYDNGWWVAYKYASGSEFTNNDAGKRFIRLVNDAASNDEDNYFRSGSEINSSTKGFRWYDSEGLETVDTGLKINVGELKDGSYEITVSPS